MAYVVDNIEFPTAEQAALAQREMAIINDIKTKVDLDDPAAVRQLFQNCQSKKVFRTKLGLNFMATLQNTVTLDSMISADVVNDLLEGVMLKDESVSVGNVNGKWSAYVNKAHEVLHLHGGLFEYEISGGPSNMYKKGTYKVDGKLLTLTVANEISAQAKKMLGHLEKYYNAAAQQELFQYEVKLISNNKLIIETIKDSIHNYGAVIEFTKSKY
jgi:hypothetical protein